MAWRCASFPLALSPDPRVFPGTLRAGYAQAQLDKELAKEPWFKPLAIQMFVGRLDPTRLHFPFSLAMGKVPASDEMDPAAIREWAGKLPQVLGLETARAEAVPPPAR